MPVRFAGMVSGNTAGKIDGFVGGGATAAGALMWMDYLELYGGAVMTIGGLAVLGIRLALGIREWMRGRDK